MVRSADSAAQFRHRWNAELLFCALVGTAGAETFSGAASRGARAWPACFEHLEFAATSPFTRGELMNQPCQAGAQQAAPLPRSTVVAAEVQPPIDTIPLNERHLFAL